MTKSSSSKNDNDPNSADADAAKEDTPASADASEVASKAKKVYTAVVAPSATSVPLASVRRRRVLERMKRIAGRSGTSPGDTSTSPAPDVAVTSSSAAAAAASAERPSLLDQKKRMTAAGKVAVAAAEGVRITRNKRQVESDVHGDQVVSVSIIKTV